MLRVRGAPAIGIAAAYGFVIGLQSGDDALGARAREAAKHLATSRPTAVNLFWALNRMREVFESEMDALEPDQLQERMLAEAKAIHEEDRQMCHAIGKHGAGLLDLSLIHI